jgi:hypothetical protein
MQLDLKRGSLFAIAAKDGLEVQAQPTLLNRFAQVLGQRAALLQGTVQRCVVEAPGMRCQLRPGYDGLPQRILSG